MVFYLEKKFLVWFFESQKNQYGSAIKDDKYLVLSIAGTTNIKKNKKQKF